MTFETFMAEYGFTIIRYILLAIFGVIGAFADVLAHRYLKDKTVRKVVKTAVRAVEQMCKDIHGEDKYNEALKRISAALKKKHLKVEPSELKDIIHEMVFEMNKKQTPFIEGLLIDPAEGDSEDSIENLHFDA